MHEKITIFLYKKLRINVDNNSNISWRGFLHSKQTQERPSE